MSAGDRHDLLARRGQAFDIRIKIDAHAEAVNAFRAS